METPHEAHPGPPKPLDDAIGEYLMACAVEGKSPRTVQAYAETLRVFRRIVTAANLPTILGGYAAADVYRFLKVIMDSPVSLGTRHRRFRETRAFFSWCVRMGYVPKHPFTGIPNVRVEQKVIQPYHRGGDPAVAGRVRCRDRVRLPQPGDHPALPRHRHAGAGTLARGGGRRPLGESAHSHPPRQGAQAAGGAVRGRARGGAARLHHALPRDGAGLSLWPRAAPDDRWRRLR